MHVDDLIGSAIGDGVSEAAATLYKGAVDIRLALLDADVESASENQPC